MAVVAGAAGVAAVAAVAAVTGLIAVGSIAGLPGSGLGTARILTPGTINGRAFGVCMD